MGWQVFFFDCSVVYFLVANFCTFILHYTDIEKIIQETREAKENNMIPEGLHSLDLYHEKQKKDNWDLKYEEIIRSYQSVLDSIRTLTYSYLVDVEVSLMNESNQGVSQSTIKTKNVFIIHGHDEGKARELESILSKDFKLTPYILNDLPDKGAVSLINKFEHYANDCSYAFAIFTPDDVVENNGKSYLQARPNVVFELGWFSAKLGRNNVCILLKDGENTEVFSDFQGVMQKRFYSNVREKYREIKLDLEDAGLI
ncbi:TIR domain-containing protein [Alkalibacillus sp. S2W]|uniref:TIR domain-containing protein n=1 Tax=Alkalibacillus sp. S2W TaxID=3386553 RepID=UPI00398CA3CD